MTKRFFKSYNDVPDGSQCHRKAYITIAFGSHCGKIGSTYSVTHSPADSALEAVARVGHIHCSCCWSKVWPYHLCQCQVQEKPDDPLNYFIGGCAGGLTLGTSAPHSYGTAAVGFVYMGTVAALFKTGKLEGRELLAKPKV